MEGRSFLITFVPMGKNWIKLVLLLCLAFIFGCQEMPEKTGTLLDFVPKDASLVLKISNWETLQNDIKNNSLLSKFSDNGLPLLFPKDAPILKNLHPSSESLLCLNRVNDSLSAYTFISKNVPNLFLSDSLKDKTIETLSIENQSFQRITIDKKIAYSAILDSVFIASSSQEILMGILKGETQRDSTFKKVYELPSAGEFTALIYQNKVNISDSVDIAMNSWSAVDISVTPDSFTASGIALTASQDSITDLLNVFKEQVPQQNDIASLIPISAKGGISFTFDDSEKLQARFREFRGEKEQARTTGIFDSSSEVGSIELNNGTAVFVKSIDAATTTDALAQFVTTHNSYRGIEIKSFSEPALFQKTFSPLLPSHKANFVFQLESFFVFVSNEDTAEELISSFQNNAVLKNTQYFEKTANDLSAASSVLILKMQGDFFREIAGFFNSVLSRKTTKLSFVEYPVMAFQFSYDRNFAHVTVSCREGNSQTTNTAGAVAEKSGIQLENALLGSPQIIGTNGKVVVQDIGNKLYYISENGKIVWTRDLGSPIIGQIEEVEVGGKSQMAFATKNAVYLLDRNGKDAKSFPLKFRDDITLPLSVFDYDQNHNYRFVVVQDKNVFLYNQQGNTVKGFAFGKAKSKIVQSPAHVRMGRKDYILIAEENGTLNILSRVGKPRVSVSTKFNFSEIPLTSEDDTFVVITKENTKERISEAGKVSSQKLNVGNYWFTLNGSTKVTMDDNLMRINGKLAELPIGLYTNPQIFEINQKIYVTITETTEKKVYVLDKNGNIINGFPVYGSADASIGKNGSAKGVILAVKSDPKELLLYTVE